MLLTSRGLLYDCEIFVSSSTGSADEDVAVRHPRPLELEVLAADDEAGAEVVLLAHQPQRLEDLVGELPRGRDHQRPRPVISAPPRAVELLQDGDQEGQGLPRPSLGSTYKISNIT